MAQGQLTPSFWNNIAKPRAVMVVAPLLVGVGAVLSFMGGGPSSAAKDSAPIEVAGVAGLPGAQGAKFAADTGTTVVNNPTVLLVSDKPAGSTPSFSAAQREEIGAIVREYLLKNPNVLVEVSTELEKQRQIEQEGNQAKVLIDEKKSIFRSPFDFVLGNPDGDVTVVEYFDYNCGWCKKALDELTQLVDADKNVRIVLKELPIFGEDSSFAARAALASIKQNKYWDFHVALMKAKRVTVGNTMDIAKSVGIDVAALEVEMAKPEYAQAIEENSRIAQALGMQGTPGFIIDSRVNFGYLPAVGLQQILSDVRKDGCKIC